MTTIKETTKNTQKDEQRRKIKQRRSVAAGIAAEDRSWIEEMHESFFWSGVVTFIFIFCFDMHFIAISLGPYLLLAKAINTGACWFCFAMGSQKTLRMGSAFLRVFNSVKKGIDIAHGEVDEDPDDAPETDPEEDR